METTLKIQLTSYKALKTKCDPVDFSDPIRLQKMGVALMNLLAEDKGYHTLTANQCGITEQIFVCRVNSTYTAYFNPTLLEIRYNDKNEIFFLDGTEVCQNFPTMSYNILRPNQIKVGWRDYMGNSQMRWLSNKPARFFLQGYDMVNGIVPYDRDVKTDINTIPEEFKYA